MEDLADSISPHQPSRSTPVREDCWSEDATFTLIEAWGQRYLDLNRGNLRQKHWQEVADAVNDRHAHLNKKAHRSDVQCKNRIDTLKKKYKTEKARVLDSLGSFHSPWPFFAPLDALIGSSPSALKKPSPSSSSMSPLLFSSPPPPPPAVMASVAAQQQALGGPPMAVPLLNYRRSVTPVVPQKRPSPVASTTPIGANYSSIRKNYSAVAAAAAAAETDEEDEEEEEVEEVKEVEDFKRNGGQLGESDGLRKLAKAIEMFGEVYARVESEKQRQVVELEKQRMQFAKELECQRMQMLVEMQVQMEKVKRVKRSNSNSNEYC